MSFRSNWRAATFIRRSKRAPSTPRSGSVHTTTRSSASTKSRLIYYYPGWWEGGPSLHGFINLAKWNELPKSYQAAITNAANYATTWMQARYDAQNPAALKRLVANGAQLRPFSFEVMDACYKATNELWAEISAKNAEFKKMIDMMTAFRNDQYLWWQVAEYTYDSFMIRARTARVK